MGGWSLGRTTGGTVRHSAAPAATKCGMNGDPNAGDPLPELGELLRSGAMIAEMHDAGCRAHTGCSCLVVVVDRDGARHAFRGEALDLPEPTVRCVCSEYR